jgi:hypothetical protein
METPCSPNRNTVFLSYVTGFVKSGSIYRIFERGIWNCIISCCGLTGHCIQLYQPEKNTEGKRRHDLFMEQNNIKNSIRTAKKTQHFTITKINWFMLFKGIIAVYTENHTEHKYKTQSY